MQITPPPSGSKPPTSKREKPLAGSVDWLADAGLMLALIGYIALAYYTFVIVGEKTPAEPLASGFGNPPFNQLAVDEAPRSTLEIIHARRPAAISR